MSHHFDTRRAARDPRLNIADVYLFDAAPDRTAMVMTCCTEGALSASAAFHPAALYEFRFDTTGNGRDDTAFQVRFTDPVDGSEHGRQEFTVHFVTGADLAAEPAHHVTGKPVFSAELKTVRHVGTIDGFAGLVGDMWAADRSAVSAMLNAFYEERCFDDAAYGARCDHISRRNVMAIALEVPNALIGDGQVAMWSSISLCGRTVRAQVSRCGIPFFSQLFLSSWRQPLVDRYNQVGPLHDVKLFAGPVRRFVAEFSALAGLGRLSEPYAIGVAARLIPTALPYRLGTAATLTTEAINGRPLDTDAFGVMASLAAGRSLGAASDVSRPLDVFPHVGPPYTAGQPTMCKEMEHHADWNCVVSQPTSTQSRR
jgi:hypothetical protein